MERKEVWKIVAGLVGFTVENIAKAFSKAMFSAAKKSEPFENFIKELREKFDLTGVSQKVENTAIKRFIE
jgi:hypothetical protein